MLSLGLQTLKSKCKYPKCLIKLTGIFHYFSFFNKNFHQQVGILNRTLMNVFSNFITNNVYFNYIDPRWMTSNLKDKLNWKNGIYKDDLINGKTSYCYLQLQHAITERIEFLTLPIQSRF